MITALLMGIIPVWGKPIALSDLQLSQLEQRLVEIDADLEQLASFSLRNGLGTGGFISKKRNDPFHTEWIQINLAEENSIEQITLVPSIRRSTAGIESEGFPAAFKLIVGSEQDSNGTVVASFTTEDHLLPRIAPLTVSFPPITASWVRLETSVLMKGNFNYVLQLSEIMIFDGPYNVALHQSVQLSSDGKGMSLAMNKETLVDGQTPYVMDAAHGAKSIAYVDNVTGIDRPSLTIDLGESFLLDRVHMHAMEVSDTVPQTNESATGIPVHMQIEGANRADFSDAALLLNYRRSSPYDTGPILMWQFPETLCRYIRFTVLDPFKGKRFAWLCFAEIEIFSRNQNVALGKPIERSYQGTKPSRSVSVLTDGLNLYGAILPQRNWLEQLARRHDLETERPRLLTELAHRYANQKTSLRRISWLAALSFVGGTTIILLQQINLRQSIFKTRERIAANLHDELGANLHAVALLGDFANKIIARSNATGELTELSEVIDDIRTLTEETGENTRYCTNMLESKEIHKDLVEEMKRSTARLLSDLEHESKFPDEISLHHLKPRKRIDLYLFHKECLTNILRHSNATHVSVQLTITEKTITLIITDNGQGIPNHVVPKSLRRRARILRAQVEIDSPNGGTQITLQLRSRRGLRLFVK